MVAYWPKYDPTSYEQFLAHLASLSPAQACWHLELYAERYGKTVRDVCSDFFAKYGVHVGS